jgi:hypothetical protein
MVAFFFSLSFAQEYVEGQVIVVYEQPIIGVLSVALSPVESYTTLSTFSTEHNETMAVVVGKNGESTQELMDQFSKDSRVKHVQPNYLYQVFSTPNDTFYSNLRGLDNIHRLETIQIFSGNKHVP